jgi:hypothetical protein
MRLAPQEVADVCFYFSLKPNLEPATLHGNAPRRFKRDTIHTDIWVRASDSANRSRD